MKTHFIIAILAIFMIILASCSKRNYVLSTEPNRPVYVRPASPGPDYTWIEGDWRHKGGRYIWYEGRWVKNKMNRNWQDGYWTSRNDNWYWKRGRWGKAGS